MTQNFYGIALHRTAGLLRLCLLCPFFWSFAQENEDSSAKWYRAFLSYESALELEKKGQYQEALNKCDEAKMIFDDLTTKFPEFHPEILIFKEQIVADTRLRIIDHLKSGTAPKEKKLEPEISLPSWRNPPVAQDDVELAAAYYRAFLSYGSALELEKKGKFQEALNKCDEAKTIYDDLATKSPQFHPDMVKFKQQIVTDTRLRILARTTSR